MPGWAGSSWYFNRYMDSTNEGEFASKESMDYWKEVDLYIGGSEHATGHLLYARFWQKFLFDLGIVPVDEFAKKLINQGMILGTSAFPMILIINTVQGEYTRELREDLNYLVSVLSQNYFLSKDLSEQLLEAKKLDEIESDFLKDSI